MLSKCISGPDRQHVRTAACQGTVVCKKKQYDFCLTVYFSRMTFCKVSTVSVYKEKKCLAKSEKVTYIDYLFMILECQTYPKGNGVPCAGTFEECHFIRCFVIRSGVNVTNVY